MTDEAVLKQYPADFLVKEVLVIELQDGADPSQQYLTLRKTGYTTMEAIRLIADKLGLSSSEVTYAGLKDEDAITEQLVAVPAGLIGQQQLDFGGTSLRHLELRHYGFGREPLRVGQLEGNAFLIELRNLPADRAASLNDVRRVNHFFLNYYDVQRFGVPGGPKRTHHVGAAMLGGDWNSAMRELIALRAPESEMAQTWSGSAEAFFCGLDARNASFYLAAHSSAQWNSSLLEIVADITGTDGIASEIEGMRYLYCRSVSQAHQVLSAAHGLPYRRYSFDQGRIDFTDSVRPTVIQTVVRVDGVREDELRQGRFRARISFFLPSGCYATAAVRQLVGYVTGTPAPA